MGRRRQSREIALQVLYQVDLGGLEARQALELYREQFELPPEAAEFAELLVLGVDDHRGQIDARIQSASEHWRLQRMPPVDRNILRIAVFELNHCPNVPAKAAINEAIELAKKYGSEDSKAFVNGVLDKLYGEIGEAGGTGETGGEEQP